MMTAALVALTRELSDKDKPKHETAEDVEVQRLGGDDDCGNSFMLCLGTA